MRSSVDPAPLRETLAKQLEVVGYNREQWAKRLYGDAPYEEQTEWLNRLWQSETEADQLDTLIREIEWGERVPPHP